ncbi:MAG: helix-turn-helix transcriptional regulator [Roseiflexaceae bacterium]|nr:helix-turn-helix transcriptional regulator [Roseiflexaceae bacterium]
MSDSSDVLKQSPGRERIRWRVKEVAKERGFSSALQLGLAIKLNKNSANSLWNGMTLRLDLDTLGRLCDLLHCTPGDLLEYVGQQRGEG